MEELRALGKEIEGGKQESLFQKLNEPRFAVKDFEVQPQYINHWRKQGLFFSDETSRGKTPFSFIDYVWILIIEQLKDVGIRFEIIRQVKDRMMGLPIWAVDIDGMIDRVIIEKPEVYAKKPGLDELEKKRKYLKRQAKLQTYFSHLVTDSIHNKKHLSFWINANAEVIHVTDKELKDILENDRYYSFFQHFYLSISITEIIRDFIETKKLHLAADILDIISEEERLVLKMIEENSLIELIIDSEGNKVDLLKEEGTDVKARFLEIITSQGYKDITFTNDRGTVTKFLNPNQIELVHGKLSEN